MKTTSILTNTAIILALSSALLLSQGGGPLQPPPGAPGDGVYKTLDEVEPRTPISTAGFLIDEPGSYYLTRNITGAPGQNGIIVEASQVTIDLCGFTLDGGGSGSGSVNGIRVNTTRQSITILNGVIKNWGGDGIDAIGANYSKVERIQSLGNGVVGIRVGFGSIVDGCIASNNANFGITTKWDCRIVNCLAMENQGAAGIEAGAGSMLKDCIASDNANTGFKTTGCRLDACTARSNDGIGIELGSNAVAEQCAVIQNHDEGLTASARCRILNNFFEANGVVGVKPNVRVSSKGSHIERNSFLEGGTGLKVEDGGNVIIRNVATRNTLDYDIVQSTNAIGPIIQAAEMETNLNPHANFEP